MFNMSIDCDCAESPEEPRFKDIGILSSLDPVALDQACVDLVYACEDKEGTAPLRKRMEDLQAVHILETGVELGIGTRNYELINIDKK